MLVRRRGHSSYSGNLLWTLKTNALNFTDLGDFFSRKILELPGSHLWGLSNKARGSNSASRTWYQSHRCSYNPDYGMWLLPQMKISGIAANWLQLPTRRSRAAGGFATFRTRLKRWSCYILFKSSQIYRRTIENVMDTVRPSYKSRLLTNERSSASSSLPVAPPSPPKHPPL